MPVTLLTDTILQPSSDGSLVASLPMPTRLPYDCANRTTMVQFDGCGGVSRYAIVGFGPVLEPDSSYVGVSINGTAWPWNATKKLSMFGRRQRVATESDSFSIICDSFLDETTALVYQEYTLRNGQPGETVFGLDFGFLDHESVRGQVDPGRGSCPVVASDTPLSLREREGPGYHLSLRLSLPAGSSGRIRLVYHPEPAGESRSDEELLAGFDAALADAKRHDAFLRERMKGSDALERAMHASALNCAISSYKDINGFKGFFAGVNYQWPPRTYYRDGYFTALPLLAHRPDLVREELLTLALGIDEAGRCPSAVIDASHVFWEDHSDSPAFFVMLLHDYVAATGDIGVLREAPQGSSLAGLALRCVDGMRDRADASGLMYRESWDRHDWADNVYRDGYVTYTEVLYYRALVCAGRIARVAARDDPGVPGAPGYAEEAERVRLAINQHLWVDSLGWYVDYTGGARTEDHLAIDTVLAVLFGVADHDRSRRLLDAMERHLETRSNGEQPFGDWGTMCCYPLYRFPDHLVEKSSRPYSYHNGSDWPYWSSLYAFAKGTMGLDPAYPLRRWFAWSLATGWATPVEYYSPAVGKGSSLQAWSSVAAFAIDFADATGFPYQLQTEGEEPHP
ncbi:MAG: hypothetical protein JXM71_05730 [Spirochaetales bacterium]|nr:hypothetical protein [Spirochaetales bacterium]